MRAAKALLPLALVVAAVYLLTRPPAAPLGSDLPTVLGRAY